MPVFLRIMIQKVYDYIKEKRLLTEGMRVLVGCSGGADSLCLLETLYRLREKLGISICVCHVNHGMRPVTADRDEAFVLEYCKKKDIPCLVKRVNVPARVKETGESSEEAARNLRYRALIEAKEALSADVTAVAHHKNDQAETVLFQMIRGSGLSGLSGMKPERDGFIRPLLSVTRAEILKFMEDEHIPFTEDETNAEDIAARNRIRHHVLPALENVRPDAAEKIAEAAEQVSLADDFIRKEALLWIRENVIKSNVIPANPFKKLHPALREYIVMEMLKSAGISLKDVGRIHIDTVAALAEKNVGKTAVLPGDAFARREYEGIRLVKDGEGEGKKRFFETAALRMETRLFPMEKGIEIPEKEYTKWFDYDKLTSFPVLRSRQPGDLFSTAPGTHKKLKDYLIDEKIPKEKRDGLLLVASGRDILWIPGLRMSEAYKITEETGRVLEIRIFPESVNENE